MSNYGILFSGLTMGVLGVLSGYFLWYKTRRIIWFITLTIVGIILMILMMKGGINILNIFEIISKS